MPSSACCATSAPRELRQEAEQRGWQSANQLASAALRRLSHVWLKRRDRAPVARALPLHARVRRAADLGVAREFERSHQLGGSLRLLASSALGQGCLGCHGHHAQRCDRLQQLTAIVEQRFDVGDIRSARLYKSALALRRRRDLDVRHLMARRSQ